MYYIYSVYTHTHKHKNLNVSTDSFLTVDIHSQVMSHCSWQVKTLSNECWDEVGFCMFAYWEKNLKKCLKMFFNSLSNINIYYPIKHINVPSTIDIP